MKKTTKKRSYKNAVSIGIAAFASVALLSTGLAAFVLIRNAQAEVTGNIEVAAVSDASIKLTVNDLVDGEIRLDADKNDKSGRVQIGAGEDEKGENLTLSFTGDVQLGVGKTIEKNLELSYKVNVYTKNASTNDYDVLANDIFNTNFIAANRLAYVKDSAEIGAETATKINVTESTDGDQTKGGFGTFNFEFGFDWGAKYGNMNPSEFFDSTTAMVSGTYGTGENPVNYTNVPGANISDADVLAELNLLSGNNGVGSTYKFVVTITAANKSAA